MDIISDIRLRWYDESSLMLEDERGLLELFLNSLGVSRKVAIDLFEVLLLAKKKGISITTRDIKKDILGLRKERKEKNPEKGLTERNIQIWLKFFRDLDLVESIGDRYLFAGNKRPSRVFIEKTKPEVVDRSCDYIHRLLLEIEDRYGIKK